MKKRVSLITIRWAWLKLREWLKKNVVDIETSRLGDMKYCLEKYYQHHGWKKKNKKSSVLLVAEYNRANSPIYKGIKTKGLSLQKKRKKQIVSDYTSYINSARWRAFRRLIISERGETCENCRSKPKSIDLHHKTYARLGNELKEDVMLLCRPCHKEIHGS